MPPPVVYATWTGWLLGFDSVTVKVRTLPSTADASPTESVGWTSSLTTTATAAVGIVLVVLGDHVVLVVAGIIIWGLGASLGFPVGMSAAARDAAVGERLWDVSEDLTGVTFDLPR